MSRGGAEPDARRGLRGLPLKLSYDTDEDDIVRDFYVPALTEAVSYDRLAGFFSSSSLSVAARGISSLVKNKGKMRLVASPKLTLEDVAAIETGGRAPDEVIGQAALRGLEGLEQLLLDDQREALSWLIAGGHLEIRLAVPTSSAGNPIPEAEAAESSLFHQKVGILSDADGDTLSFSGSVNETMRGWTRNIEEFKVFRSWVEGERGHLASDQAKFEKYWNKKAKNTLVVDVPQAVREKLVEYVSYGGMGSPQPRTEAPINLWKHQDEASALFLESPAGILEMATGTGKTRTSLKIAETLFAEGKIDSIVIATAGNDLLQQWYRELIDFFGESKMLVRREFGERKEARSFFIHNSALPTSLVISYDNLADQIKPDRQMKLTRSLLICDEIHNAGSEARARDLAGKLKAFPYRLGLSATPEREYDPEGTDFIEREIGPVIFRFSIESAIRSGVLCEFDYSPLLYELNDEDSAKIPQAYARHAARKRANPRASVEELYRDLANVRKESRAKLPLFARYIAEKPGILENCVIFVANMEYGHLVQEIVHKQSKSYHTYYGDDDDANLHRFARGELKTLITCKRISEGIDVRSIQNVVLFACDRARLQTTQRIGRCLRRDPQNATKRPRVLDFILRSDVQPGTSDPDPDYTPVDADRFDWLTTLSRVRKEQ